MWALQRPFGFLGSKFWEMGRWGDPEGPMTGQSHRQSPPGYSTDRRLSVAISFKISIPTCLPRRPYGSPTLSSNTLKNFSWTLSRVLLVHFFLPLSFWFCIPKFFSKNLSRIRKTWLDDSRKAKARNSHSWINLACSYPKNKLQFIASPFSSPNALSSFFSPNTQLQGWYYHNVNQAIAYAPKPHSSTISTPQA